MPHDKEKGGEQIYVHVDMAIIEQLKQTPVCQTMKRGYEEQLTNICNVKVLNQFILILVTNWPDHVVFFANSTLKIKLLYP